MVSLDPVQTFCLLGLTLNGRMKFTFPYLMALSVLVFQDAGAATSFGVNFNNNDTAGSQVAGNLGAAAWTNVNSATGEALAIGGTPSVTMNWTASEFYYAGSWQSTTDGNLFNQPIGMMRIYLDDSDTPAVGTPALLGAVAGDGIGVTVNLQGMAAWLAAAGATGYTIHAYFSTDTVGATFQPLIARNGNTVTSTIIDSAIGVVQGNGQWNGTIVDAGGNQSEGTRGDATFGTVFNQDNLTLTMAKREDSARGTLAGFVITAVPEPGAALLGGLGLLALLRRRRD